MIELNEDGFIQLKIGDVEKQIDLYAVNNEITEIARATQGKPLGEYHDAIAAMLERLGYPRVSHRLCVLIQERIDGVIADLKKVRWGFAEARLARVYGAAFFGASPRSADRLKMALWERSLWAEEKLRDTPNLSPESKRWLTLLATDSEEAADDAWARAELRRMSGR